MVIPIRRNGPRLTKDRAVTAAKHFGHEEVAAGKALEFKVLAARMSRPGRYIVSMRELGPHWTLEFDVLVALEHGKLSVKAHGHEPFYEPEEEEAVSA